MIEASRVAEPALLQLSPDQCHALCHALPRADNLDAAMRIVEGVRHSLLGAGLLTVNLDVSRPVALVGMNVGTGSAAGANADSDAHADTADTITLERIWSSNPVAYPLAGRKRKTLTPWTQQLMRSAEVFVGEGVQALAHVFDDHSVITGLGMQAVVNVPLLDDAGCCFATFNALGPRPSWLPQEVLALRLLATLATPAVRRAVNGAVAEGR